MATGVRIGGLDLPARAAEALRIEQAALSAATGARVPDARADVFRQHARRPGFRCVGATTMADPGGTGEGMGELVGFGYGYVEQPGSWWRQHVEPALARAGRAELLDVSFTVAELHVRPDRQGEGIGADLLAELLRSVDQSQVLLTTQQDGNLSRGFYQRLGFAEVAPVVFPGLAPYVVLARPLPLASRVRVRRATESDIPAIRTVAYGTWPVTYAGLRSPQGIGRGLASWWSTQALAESVPRGGDLVATVDGTVIGVARHDVLEARYAPRPDWAGVPVLWCLYVLPAWHGAGAGRALLGATLSDVEGVSPDGRPRLVLDCVEGNERATAFYLRQGMRQVLRQDGVGDEPACWWFEMPALDGRPLA